MGGGQGHKCSSLLKPSEQGEMKGKSLKRVDINLVSCSRDLGIKVGKGASQERWKSLGSWFKKMGHPTG